MNINVSISPVFNLSMNTCQRIVEVFPSDSSISIHTDEMFGKLKMDCYNLVDLFMLSLWQKKNPELKINGTKYSMSTLMGGHSLKIKIDNGGDAVIDNGKVISAYPFLSFNDKGDKVVTEFPLRNIEIHTPAERVKLGCHDWRSFKLHEDPAGFLLWKEPCA
jgi:hypothetical protein